MQDVLALKQGSHVCLLYEKDPEEQLSAILPYLQQGLKSGERCLYVADASTLARLEAALDEYGIDVPSQTRRGALLFWRREQWPSPGEVDAETGVRHVHKMIDEALSDGFSGIRFGIEMTWTMSPHVDAELLRRWEKMIDSVFTGDLPARMICQYGRGHLEPAAVLAALRTHPLTVLGEGICPNPYYAPPESLDAPPTLPPSAAPVDWMIAQLHWMRAFENEREQRVRAEGALAAAESSQRRIEELYSKAAIATEDLRKANAIKDEFVGLVSHELRTPITVILGNATVLLKSMSFTNDAHYSALQDIRSEAERLSRLVSNMLVLAKLDGSRQQDLEPMLIGPVVARVAAEHQRRHGSRQINIQLLDIGTPCLANAGYVEQILANLLSNAEKYSSPNEAVELTLSRTDEWLTLTVADRGIGLDIDASGHLFEAFFRADAASNLSAGIGIGLAACKRLVEAQDGQISAKPRDGGGAEFGFSLRVVEAPE